WRTAAFVGVAAIVLLLALRLEVRVNDRQLVLRWGSPEPAAAAATTVIVQREIVPPSDLDERLARMSELIRALAKNADAADRERAEQLSKLRQEFNLLQKENQRRWSQTRQEVDALYTAQFGSRQLGANP